VRGLLVVLTSEDGIGRFAKWFRDYHKTLQEARNLSLPGANLGNFGEFLYYQF
jgi:hypothetical protein